MLVVFVYGSVMEVMYVLCIISDKMNSSWLVVFFGIDGLWWIFVCVVY